MVASRAESEWDEEQVDLLRAEARLTRLTGAHGEYLPDATSDAASPTNYTSGWGYRVEGPFTNHAEKARQDAIDAWKKDAGDKPNMNGMYWTVDRVDY